MTKRTLKRAMLTMALVLGMAFVWGQSGKGTLTVNNCPEEAMALICVNSDPKTMMELLGAVSKYVAAGTISNSSSELMSTAGENFSSTGKFLVIVLVDSDVYFIGNVSFTDGSATIDFKSMTAQLSLPVS